MRDVAHQIAFTQLNVNIKALAQASSIFSKSIKHRPQITRRRTDNAQYVRSRGLELQRLPQLAQQPCVLDGNHSLGGEVLNQGNLLVSKWSNLLAKNAHYPDQLVAFEHWDGQIGPYPAKLNGGNNRWTTFNVGFLSGGIDDVNCVAFQYHSTERSFAVGQEGGTSALLDQS